MGRYTATFTGNVGIRQGIAMKVGQASIHRQSNDPEKGVCGIPIARIRQVRPTDYYHRCPRCFDKQLGHTGGVWMMDFFGLKPPASIVTDDDYEWAKENTR